MRKKIEWLWEELDTKTFRAKVIGGWVLKCLEGKAISTIFIADRDTEWTIIQPVKEVEAAKPIVFTVKAADFEPK